MRSRKTQTTNLARLARHFGEEHWREVVRLFVAMAAPSLFDRFLTEVVSAGRLARRNDFTSVCLREAKHPSVRPLRAALRDPVQRYEALQALGVLLERIPEPVRRLAEEMNAQAGDLFGVAAAELSAGERQQAMRLLAVATEPPVAVQPSTGEGPSVFISYSTRDRRAVERLEAALHAAGIRIWRDAREIRPGDLIAKSIERGVAGTAYFLAVISPHFLRSSWAQLEENLAWQREVEEGRIVMVPILLRGKVADLPLRYRQRRFVDLRRDFDAGVAELTSFLRGGPAELPAVRVNPVDGTELILIPAGAFQAGDAEESDNPRRPIELPAFYLARLPVTNAQYRRFLDASPGRDVPGPFKEEGFNEPEQPVVGVSVADAEAYCDWAKLRLPTEWEWEKGARGTDGRPFPWGKPQPSKTRANFAMEVGRPTPVGSYPDGASPYGLLDMAGNVWEWTASVYSEDPLASHGERRAQPRRDATERRSVRGGSFDSRPRNLRAAFRFRIHPEVRRRSLGFRCAQDS